MKIKIFVISVIAILFFVSGFITSNKLNSKVEVDTEKYYQEGWNAAKQRLYETGALAKIEIEYPIKSVYGVITNIDKNKLYIKISPVEALAEPALDNRIVVIDENTQIYIYVRQDQEFIDRELEEQLQQGLIEEPELYFKKEVSISELQPQKTIVVNSTNDIRNEKQFIANEIIIRGD